MITWIFIVGAMFVSGKGDISPYLDIPSVMIVTMGTVGATVAAFPGDILKALGGTLKRAFVSNDPDLLAMVQTIVSFAEKARREGLLALEGDVAELKDEFLRKSIQLVVDGTDP